MILAYAALPDELDLAALMDLGIRQGKGLAVPRYDQAAGSYDAARWDPSGRATAIGHLGVTEPLASAEAVALNTLDLILVPGLGFDVEGGRLGRGKGFYDRMLARATGRRCGVAYDWQIVVAVPSEPHDVAMHCIATPSRWIFCAAADVAL
jgi:5-formyltetrahydrofolate cyclo-ligase